jgi:hypothetical protein
MQKVQKHTFYVDGTIRASSGTVEYKNNSFKEKFIGINMELTNYSHRKMLVKVEDGIKKVELWVKYPYQQKFLAYTFDNTATTNCWSCHI